MQSISTIKTNKFEKVLTNGYILDVKYLHYSLNFIDSGNVIICKNIYISTQGQTLRV